MLNPNIFKKELESIVDNVFLTLLSFDKEYNSILKIDNLEESSLNTKNILPGGGAVEIASILSQEEGKNIFLINEDFNDHLKNISTGLQNNFYKIYSGLTRVSKKNLNNKNKILNLSVLNISSPRLYHENRLNSFIYRESGDINVDVAMLRSLGSVNIFVPADKEEASYLLKVAEKNFFKKNTNNLSYFKISGTHSPKIFDSNFFEKDGHLREWTGMPEIVYISKNIDSVFDISIIACGPILYNALIAAKELEDRNYKVTVLNMSLINSNSEIINQKIENYINNFSDNHKNIITIEEHSRNGGMGSLIAEVVSRGRHSGNVRVERMGLENDLSPRNIISKSEEIIGF